MPASTRSNSTCSCVSRHDTPAVGGPCANRQRVGSDVNTACGDNDDPTEHQIAKGGGGRFSRRCDHFNQRSGNEVAYPRFCAVQGDCGLGFRQPRRTNHRALFSVFLFQAFRERLVSAESRHPRSGAMDRMGNVASKILPCRWCASGLVAGSQGCVLPGISKVSFGTKPADELGSLNELFDYVERNG
jgi:hypothetical protein